MLQAIAHSLGGKVRRGKAGTHVVAPGPGCKRKDRSLSVWMDGENPRVHSHRGIPWQEAQAYVRQRCGLPDWKPQRPKTRKRRKPAVSFPVRNMFLGETLAICRHRKTITFDQMALLINDLRLTGSTAIAMAYVREFGFAPSDLERCMLTQPRHHTADQRAEIFQLSYAERQSLQLRRTGSIDVDKAGRERARRERYNAKRRASRARANLSGVNRVVPSSSKPTVVRGSISVLGLQSYKETEREKKGVVLSMFNQEDTVMDAITNEQTTLFAPDETAPIDPKANGSALMAQIMATQAVSQPTVARQENPQDNFWAEARTEGLLVAEWQPLTAVYVNTANAVVIRQESADCHEDDQCIYMRPDRLPALIDQLCTYAKYYPTKKAR